jgi:molybdopterin-containing oxidoreductase family membrane subunit
MWFKKLRTSLLFTFFISIVVNIGMWFERFVIIVTSIHRDYLPSSWIQFYPTWTDIGIFIGTIGIFFVFYLLFSRYFPVLAMAELKTIVKISGESYKNEEGDIHQLQRTGDGGTAVAHSHEEVTETVVEETVVEETTSEEANEAEETTEEDNNNDTSESEENSDDDNKE